MVFIHRPARRKPLVWRNLFLRAAFSTSCCLLVARPPTPLLSLLTSNTARRGTLGGIHAFSVLPNHAVLLQRQQRIQQQEERLFHTSSAIQSYPTFYRPLAQRSESRRTQSPVRLYSSRRDKDGDSLLSKVGGVVKSILPKRWFADEKEKAAIEKQQRIQGEIQGGLSEILKDAPLPIKLFGKALSPLISSAMSGLAQTMAEQQELLEQVMTQAETYLANDDAVQRALNGDSSNTAIQMGVPFSQSSSSSSINGQTTAQIELAFPVTGRLTSGIARLVASKSDDKDSITIQQLQVQANGRMIPVSLNLSSSQRRKRSSSSSGSDENIIEAEIIEKDTKL